MMDMDKDDSYVNVNTISKREKKENCVIRLFRKMFGVLYPGRMIEAQTNVAKDLRCVIGCSCVMHCFFFVFCLALVGPSEMFVNLMLAAWTYSCYLTLYEMVILLYLVFLGIAVFSGLFYSVESGIN